MWSTILMVLEKIGHFQTQTTLQFVHFMVFFYDITHIVYN